MLKDTTASSKKLQKTPIVVLFDSAYIAIISYAIIHYEQL